MLFILSTTLLLICCKLSNKLAKLRRCASRVSFISTMLMIAPSGRLHKNSWGNLVVLHPDHHLLLHRQPRRLPHRRQDDHADRERGGSGQAEGDCLWNPERRQHHDLLQRLQDPNIQENVGLHGGQEALSVCEEL